MTATFRELDVVRVVRLLTPTRGVDGTASALRQPVVDDVAAVVHVLGDGAAYIVECVTADGRTAWVAEFVGEELEPADGNSLVSVDE